jgi:N-acyl-L-homoserine lactone synthetase
MALRLITLNSKTGSQPDCSNDPFNAAFRLRYIVYHDESGVIDSNKEKRILDIFDLMDTTFIFLVTDGDVPAGTMRLTRYSEQHGLPMLQDFKEELERELDFQESIKNGKIYAEPSRFTVLRNYRHDKGRLVPGILTCMMHDRCVLEAITDLVMVANPEQQGLYEKFGFKTFAWKKDTLTGIVSPAMHAEVSGSFGKMVEFLKENLKRKGVIINSGKVRQEAVND